MSGFLSDLEEGKGFELLVLDILKSEYPSEDWIINPERLGVDILSSSWRQVEVKYDRMGNKTWNIFIEVECNGKPSWINKYGWQLDVLAYWYKKESTIMLYLINANILKSILHNPSFRKVKWGDWWRSVWILVPISFLKENIIISKEIELYGSIIHS